MKIDTQHGPRKRQDAAFTLLEVIIACAIFFMCAFAILGVVTQGLSAARKMQIKEPDIGMALVTSGLVLSNVLVEGAMSGDFEELFPGIYPDWSWDAEVLEVGSNGFFRVDIALHGKQRTGRGSTESRAYIYQFAPNSPPGSASKGRL